MFGSVGDRVKYSVAVFSTDTYVSGTCIGNDPGEFAVEMTRMTRPSLLAPTTMLEAVNTIFLLPFT